MNTLKVLAASALALTLAGPAAAQQDWDMDADGRLTGEEFNTGFSAAGSFGSYDTDGDGMLSEAEYDTAFEGKEAMFEGRDYQMGTFADADANADGMLDENEYGTGFFNTYDADTSGYIEEPELGDIGDDMGDGGLFDI